MNAVRKQRKPRPAASLLAASLLCAFALPAAAQFPSKPIRIIVPYTAGGTSETMTRLVADQMSTALKQPVVIENRPGGGTTIGAAVVAQAPADGHTLFVNASSFLINAHLMSKLPYDAARDFMPVTLAASNPHVLVAFSGLGVTSVKDFMAMARSKGKSMSYGSFGNGSSGHLAFELLKKAYNFDMQHIPYKGSPQALADVMGGNLQAMLTDLPAAVPQVKAGKLLGLGVAAEKRSPALPDMPTIEEAGGTKFISRSWFGFLVRSGTPPEVHKVLNQEIVRALRKPEVKARLADLGMDTYGTSAEEFDAFMKSESARFADAISSPAPRSTEV
ncbi:MAG: tripartite tricarboxylate transporter substrate binding protein [Betaproteobacteria bacterium]|nr:tripartite tricarboxylate transporter substrate binding protein [Betaproteobacteria bacterium]